MNLRISHGELRFRIAREELERLLSGETLTLDVPPFLTAVIRTGEVSGTPLHLSCEDRTLALTVSAPSAQTLLSVLPSREGLKAQQEQLGCPPLALLLEVDIRSQKRKSA